MLPVVMITEVYLWQSRVGKLPPQQVFTHSKQQEIMSLFSEHLREWVLGPSLSQNGTNPLWSSLLHANLSSAPDNDNLGFPEAVECPAIALHNHRNWEHWAQKDSPSPFSPTALPLRQANQGPHSESASTRYVKEFSKQPSPLSVTLFPCFAWLFLS